MEFVKSHTQTIPFEGQYPSTVHLPNNEIMCFWSDGTNLMVAQSEIYPTANIDWSNVEWKEPVIATPDTGLTYIKLKSVPRIGFFGVWTQTGEERQRFAIYKGETDISDWITQANISLSADTPTAPLNMTLTNQQQDSVSEGASNVNPGAKVTIAFSMGDDGEQIPLGIFYVDSTNMSVTGNTANITARNISGKLLNDQFFGNKGELSKKLFKDNVIEILTNAGVTDFDVQELSTWEVGFSHAPNKSVMDGLQEMLDVASWKMIETQDGQIIVGDPNYYAPLKVNSKYTFERDKLIARAVQRDDGDVYKQVCVHTKTFSSGVYLDLDLPIGWEVPYYKIYFHEVPDGTNYNDMTKIAERLRENMNYGGTVETFTSRFAPQLLAGDEAEIIDFEGKRVIGYITNVTHNFGMSGFSTNFTVDSGGRLGKPKILTHITQAIKKEQIAKGILTE